MQQPAIVFDFNRTIYDPDTDTLVPGMAQLLVELYSLGVPLFLISKGNGDREALIKRLGIAKFFMTVIVSEKKSAQDFQECKTTLPGFHFIAIGDRLSEEIRLANSCGMTTIRLKIGKFASENPSSKEEIPNYTVHSAPELLPLLFQLMYGNPS